jgi:hypothetical protein
MDGGSMLHTWSAPPGMEESCHRHEEAREALTQRVRGTQRVFRQPDLWPRSDHPARWVSSAGVAP